MNLKLKRPLAFIDIEATGINVASDRIVEIAILKIMPDNEKLTKVIRVNPGIPIPAEVSLIHGIYDEDIAECPFFKDVANDINDFLDNCDIAGYNSDRFDIPILIEEFLRLDMVFDCKNRKFIDVFRIFTLMEKRDLTSAYKFYCNKELVNAHSAETDTTATYEVFSAQLNRYESLSTADVDSLHDLTRDGDFVDFGRRMINLNGHPCFNFGKHKGRRVADVLRQEPQYYDWIMKNDFLLDTKQKLKEIRLMMKINGR